MLLPDPIVDEARRIRVERSAKHGNDLKKIVEALQELERTSGREYFNYEPNRRIVPGRRYLRAERGSDCERCYKQGVVAF